MTAIEKKFTVSFSPKVIQGVLLLAAGYGTRAEPLTFLRPKALLPYGNTTLLGKLIKQFVSVNPDTILVNTSRCPELIAHEVLKHWSGNMKVLFEERPLGAAGTLSRNRKLLKGTWILSNTDVLIDIPINEMVKQHFKSGSDWTVLTGDFPDYGKYGALLINDKSRHYLGISIISERIVELAFSKQLSFGFFSNLRNAAKKNGIEINEFFSDREWLDMGEVDLYRKHLLDNGNFIHPEAQIHPSVIFEGVNWIGNSCVIERDAYICNSVVLEKAVIMAGAIVVDSVVPMFSRRGAVE